MHITTDTNSRYSNHDIEDGTFQFRINSIEQRTKGETIYYILNVNYPKGEGEQVLLPSMMGQFLRLMGARESLPNVFDWDTDNFNGKYFVATVTHAPDKKDPQKIRQHMSNFQPATKDAENEIPF